jgi:hypothetical protein
LDVYLARLQQLGHDSRFAILTGTANPTTAELPDGESICELIPIHPRVNRVMVHLNFQGWIEASV